MEQFDRFEATFQPKRTDDLKPGAVNLIGRRLEWEALYVLDVEESGDPMAYSGLFACALLTDLPEGTDFVWAPECDLAGITSVTRGWGLHLAAASVAAMD